MQKSFVSSYIIEISPHGKETEKSTCRHLFWRNLHRKVIRPAISLMFLKVICSFLTHLISKTNVLVQIPQPTVIMSNPFLKKASDMLLLVPVLVFVWIILHPPGIFTAQIIKLGLENISIL